ncbi:hypothetical protein GS940_18685 [Rhodococcus hoagii]|nr:hypothetical protein [Prescottella equi]
MKKPFRNSLAPGLLERVWKWSYGDLSTVTVHVRRLRKRWGNYSRSKRYGGGAIAGSPDLGPAVAASSDERLAGPRH